MSYLCDMNNRYYDVTIFKVVFRVVDGIPANVRLEPETEGVPLGVLGFDDLATFEIDGTALFTGDVFSDGRAQFEVVAIDHADERLIAKRLGEGEHRSPLGRYSSGE